MIQFVGRIAEIQALQRKNWRGRAQLIVVYGRRRVGKTALVEKAFEKRPIWKFEGLESGTTRQQIRHFISALSQYCGESLQKEARQITDWQAALMLLEKKLPSGNPVIFFDEFQWMANMRQSLVSAFKWAWDNGLCKRKHCTFVLCGSVSSFIVRKVLRSSALYGRVDLEIDLDPFSLLETKDFFQSRRGSQEVMEAFMALGGIPQYLLELNPQQSIVQNLSNLAFEPSGYFFREYHRLFVSHFGKNANYEQILRSLSHKGNQSLPELAKSVRMKQGGTFSQLLDDLELAGFLDRYTPIDKPEKSRLIKMRIQDEFLHFYFRFVEKNRRSIEAQTAHAYQILTGPAFDQWRGYAFERLCIKHAKRIARALGFSGIRYEAGAWFRRGKDANAQIDLLFKRADGVSTLCEAKYVNRLNGPKLLNSINAKVEALVEHHGQTIQKVLILGKRVRVPLEVQKGFDAVLHAEDIFL